MTWVTFAEADSQDSTELCRASNRRTRESEKQVKIFQCSKWYSAAAAGHTPLQSPRAWPRGLSDL